MQNFNPSINENKSIVWGKIKTLGDGLWVLTFIGNFFRSVDVNAQEDLYLKVFFRRLNISLVEARKPDRYLQSSVFGSDSEKYIYVSCQCLRKLRIGTVWENGKYICDLKGKIFPEYSKEINITPEMYDHIILGSPENPEEEDKTKRSYPVQFIYMPFPLEAAKTNLLKLITNDYVFLIPKIEIIRFFFTHHPNLIHAILLHGGPHEGNNNIYHMTNDKGIMLTGWTNEEKTDFKIRLRKSIRDLEAPVCAYMAIIHQFNYFAQSISKSIHGHLKKETGASPSCSNPYYGNIKFQVMGKRIKSKNNNWYFFVTQIIAFTIPCPYERLAVTRDNPGQINGDNAKLKEDKPKKGPKKTSPKGEDSSEVGDDPGVDKNHLPEEFNDLDDGYVMSSENHNISYFLDHETEDYEKRAPVINNDLPPKPSIYPGKNSNGKKSPVLVNTVTNKENVNYYSTLLIMNALNDFFNETGLVKSTKFSINDCHPEEYDCFSIMPDPLDDGIYNKEAHEWRKPPRKKKARRFWILHLIDNDKNLYFTDFEKFNSNEGSYYCLFYRSNSYEELNFQEIEGIMSNVCSHKGRWSKVRLRNAFEKKQFQHMPINSSEHETLIKYVTKLGIRILKSLGFSSKELNIFNASETKEHINP